MPTPPSPDAPPSLADLRARAGAVMVRDQRTLRRQLDRVRGLPDGARPAAIEDLHRAVLAAEERVAQRRAQLPVPRYPAGLPVSEKKDDILAAIRDHQVVIVAGETGSGKSTQLPKICLELGRGLQGLVGHTQPRRIAARSVAERIAEELGTELGDLVGYTVRFTDQVSDRTFVKVMTDGILLAEIQRDRLLTRYDTLIVDEAHERSLNIDFILGYLKQLLPKRPDLKVIVTSATIDTERFSRHFDDAPVVEVSGRTYPVEVRYEPVVDDEEDTGRDQIQAVGDAVEELCAEGPGDILVFLSGEREIRDTADALHRMDLRDTEILPLYARLSAAEQHRVFAAHRGRRIVLATNVAETSLTVPGVRFVVDPGTARISRYNRRTKVQRLPIEAISQASANQRAGRCGRVAPGICIRLYAEEDFEARPEFTEPEILRTNLASVILQMAAIGLGDVAAFPFVEPPDARSIKDGVALLEELGALDPGERDVNKRLTPLGRRLAQLPLDPRFGRMVLEAERNGCLHEVMVIAAALSIQDPRERPTGKEQAAAEQHARFADPDSDFISYLKLWDHLKEQQRELSSSQFRKLCKTEFLHFLRIREWQDIYTQLRQVIRTLGFKLNSTPGDRDGIHRSLLSGLLSHIGLNAGDRREYQGARGARFAIAPGSALFKKSPRWLMAAELVETNRMWARVVARIQPEWAEALAPHLVQRTYSEPHWDAGRGAAMAFERVTLYGVPIVANRKVNFGRIDPEYARDLFIRHALVEGDWQTHHRFFHENAALVADVRALEERARRRGILVDDDALFAFYDERVPRDVTSTRHFDRWWNKHRTRQPDLLSFTPELLIDPAAGRVALDDFPDTWRQADLELALSYRFEPGSELDGVTVDIPLAVLNRVEASGFDWHVPGFREELVTALIRSLPKPVRRAFVPAPDYAKAFLDQAAPVDGPLLERLTAVLTRLTGDPIPPGSWHLEFLPEHLRITFRVVDERGQAVAVGKDLDRLQRLLRERMRQGIAGAAQAHAREQVGLTTWTIGTLPRVVVVPWQGHLVKAYPALVDEGDTVAVRMLPSPDEQERATWAGTRRLLLLAVPSPAKALQRLMTNETKLALARLSQATVDGVLADCVTCALDEVISSHGGPAWDEEAFAKLVDAVRSDLTDVAVGVFRTVGLVLVAAAGVGRRLAGLTAPALAPSVSDARSQLARLVHPGFVTATGARRLGDLLRYLQAIEHRLDKLPASPVRDLDLTRRVQDLEDQYARLLDVLPPDRAAADDVRHIHWMIEELRVSLFAQQVGTAFPVSEKRVARALEEAAG